MGSLVLNKNELAEITGYVNPKHQRQWLDRNRWIYQSNRAGSPIVARDYFMQRMGVKSSGTVGIVGEVPNFDAIRVIGKRMR